MEEKKIRTTVIIPNYCHAPYLPERIESVLNQTRQDFEVIILDDCSQDNSREVIEQYRNHPKVSHIIYNEQNTGSPFKQWQKGFALAQGEYIWIAESDDVADKAFLEVCAGALDQSPSRVLAYTDFLHIDKASRPIGGSCLARDLGCKEAPYKDFSAKAFTQRMLFQNYVTNASMALFRKCALPQEAYYADFRYVGDWLFWIEVARRGETRFINRPLDHFRQHGENTTQKSQKGGANIQEALKLYDYILPRVETSALFRLFLIGNLIKRLQRMGLSVGNFKSPLLRHPRWAKCWYRLARTLGVYRI